MHLQKSLFSIKIRFINKEYFFINVVQIVWNYAKFGKIHLIKKSKLQASIKNEMVNYDVVALCLSYLVHSLTNKGSDWLRVVLLTAHCFLVPKIFFGKMEKLAKSVWTWSEQKLVF